MANVAYVKTELSPDMPPPVSETGIIGWMRQNLFSTWYNTLATLIIIYIFYSIIPGLIDWAFLSATWEASSREDCRVEGAGACWGFVEKRFNFLMYGFYEPAMYWRPNLVGLILLLAFVPVLFDKIPGRGLCAAFLIFVFPWIAVGLLYGPVEMDSLSSGTGWAIYLAVLVAAGAYGWRAHQRRSAGGTMLGYGIVYCIAVILFLSWGFGLENVQTNKFGGLMLTLVLATVGIAVSLPLGIVLALGRRADNMPAVQMLCIGFIELIRAVPLITVLFMAQFMLPLFLPEGVNFDNLVRALVGFSLFAAAYMAEVVRGGLQAISKGQFEAADAMGLNYAMSMRLIVLPQALKIVIPGIVSTFIGLFKDTTLVSIIGLMDMLLAAKASITDAKWLGLEHEAYIFVGFVYFVFCFGMSRYSIFLEGKLHTGHKR